jgi:hypothetical protein
LHIEGNETEANKENIMGENEMTKGANNYAERKKGKKYERKRKD